MTSVYVFKFDWEEPVALYLCQDDEDNPASDNEEKPTDKPDEGLNTKINEIVGKRTKSMFNNLERMINDIKGTSLSKNDFQSFVDSFKNSGKSPTLESKPADNSKDSSDDKSNNKSPPVEEIEDGLRIQLADIQTRVKTLEQEKTLLEDSLEKERKDAKFRDRDLLIIKELEARGAGKHAEQILQLTKNDFEEVPEKGWMAKVETEFGPDHEKPGLYLERWLDRNPHFSLPLKSGSGGGGSGSSPTEGSFLYSEKDLKSMDLKTYAANRDKIQKDFERRAGLRRD